MMMNDENTGEARRSAPRPNGAAFARLPARQGFFVRLIQLCIMPEQWTLAARYSLSSNIAVTVVAILIVALLMGTYTAAQTMTRAHAFAAAYDARHAPLVISRDGKIAYADGKGENSEPIRFLSTLLGDETTVVIDPLAETDVHTINTPRALVVTNKEVISKNGDKVVREPLTRHIPLLQVLMTTPSVRIDSQTMQQYLIDHAAGLRLGVLLMSSLYTFFTHSLWILAMVLLFYPLVAMGAHKLHMPRMIACRIALAVNVPLMALSIGLTLAGYSVKSALGSDGAVVFWGIATATLCFWAGLLANRMYKPAEAPRRNT